MKAGVNRNPKKARFGVNYDRPSGANAASASSDPRELLMAALHGNRESRRHARKNLKKQLKAEGVIK